MLDKPLSRAKVLCNVVVAVVVVFSCIDTLYVYIIFFPGTCEAGNTVICFWSEKAAS